MHNINPKAIAETKVIKVTASESKKGDENTIIKERKKSRKA